MLTIPLTNGRSITAPDVAENPGGCHFLAVMDTGGEQLMHTTFEQWETAPEREIRRFARAATKGSIGDELGYGPELTCVLAEHPGIELRIEPDGDYVRVVDLDRDPEDDDQELVYWACDEFADDPELVAGALLGALVQGG